LAAAALNLYALYTYLPLHQASPGWTIFALVALEAVALTVLGSRSGASAGVAAFRSARRILDPVRDRYLHLGRPPTSDEKEAIAAHESELRSAIDLFKQALDKHEESQSNTPLKQQDRAILLHEIGLTYRILGELTSAKMYYLEAQQEMASSYNKINSPRTINQYGLVFLHMGELEHISGRFDDAVEWYVRAVALFNQAQNGENLTLTSRLRQHAANKEMTPY
jgi:tetratricopeptide (TPR) repeat protein